MKEVAVYRTDIDASLDLLDKLSDECDCRKQAAAIVRKLVKKYIESAAGSPLVDGVFTKEEIAEMRNGKKIAAIKLVRDRTGMSLMDCKNLVENNGEHYLRSYRGL